MQEPLFTTVKLEDFVPSDHPLRPLRLLVNQALKRLNGLFSTIYADSGRASIAPEKLLRALLLQVFYSVRSERMLMEQMRYNLLFRWFVGLAIEDAVWDHSVFSKNRDRLLEHEVVEAFFTEVMSLADKQGLLSREHFSVVSHADGFGERASALRLLDCVPGRHAKTLGADKGYDMRDFVRDCRARKVTPHVARNDAHQGGSAIDGRTSRHVGYGISQVIRKRIEEHFGWGKTVGRIRQTVYRGIKRVDQHFKLTMLASNLTRMARILAAVPQGAVK
ncbi:transposase DDE domain protein [Burkholderia ubonensis MSMB22]|nr:transposase DDE domain protein [Burkholderia ubonensis MSMB22]